MTLSRGDLLGRWGASPEIDEFFQSVEFRDDGTGTVRSAGGHALCLFANFRWEFESDGRVALQFQETIQKPWPDYTPTEGARSHHVRCELEVGEFALRVPALMGTATYRGHGPVLGRAFRRRKLRRLFVWSCRRQSMSVTRTCHLSTRWGTPAR